MGPDVRALSWPGKNEVKQMSANEKVRQFIITNYYVADPSQLSDDDSLLDGGIIDSTGVLELIFFLEEEFAITVEDSEVIPDNLDTIGRTSRFAATNK